MIKSKTIKLIADSIGVDQSTIYRWQRESNAPLCARLAIKELSNIGVVAYDSIPEFLKMEIK